MDRVNISSLDRSSSWNGLPTNMRKLTPKKQKIKGNDDIIAAPAAFSDNFYPTPKTQEGL